MRTCRDPRRRQPGSAACVFLSVLLRRLPCGLLGDLRLLIGGLLITGCTPGHGLGVYKGQLKGISIRCRLWGSSVADPKLDQPSLRPNICAQGSELDDISSSGSEFGSEVDFASPDPVRRIGAALARSAPEPKPVPETWNLVELRALHAHIRAKIRLIKLRAGSGFVIDIPRRATPARPSHDGGNEMPAAALGLPTSAALKQLRTAFLQRRNSRLTSAAGADHGGSRTGTTTNWGTIPDRRTRLGAPHRTPSARRSRCLPRKPAEIEIRRAALAAPLSAARARPPGGKEADMLRRRVRGASLHG